MIIHEIMPYQLYSPFWKVFSKQLKINNSIMVGIEDFLPMISSLSNVMNPAGDYNALSTCHKLQCFTHRRFISFFLLKCKLSLAPYFFLEGSAKRALRTTLPFDKYIFIEKDPERCKQLENLKNEFPTLANDIDIRQEDANEEIQNLANKDWRSRRAVLFLDPYGMQVEWKTLEAIANTKAIDLWLLFPLGIGVNRLLKKSGDIPDS
jgi:hypothetical protein